MAAGIAMLLELPQPHTAVVTVFVLMQPLSGMVLAKSFFTGSSEPCSERWRPSELSRIAAPKFFWGGETTRAIGNRSAADQPPDSPYEPLAESATTACVLRRALRKNGCTRGCDFVTAIGAGATDHLMPDVMKVEGIMGWMRVTAIAQARGLPVSNHLSRKSART
jgi:hypothetical protein